MNLSLDFIVITSLCVVASSASVFSLWEDMKEWPPLRWLVLPLSVGLLLAGVMMALQPKSPACVPTAVRTLAPRYTAQLLASPARWASDASRRTSLSLSQAQA